MEVLQYLIWQLNCLKMSEVESSEPIMRSNTRRRVEASQLMENHPNSIPVILERGFKSSLPILERNQLLVPKHLTFTEFHNKIRCKLSLAK
jgi:hypothetical protein